MHRPDHHDRNPVDVDGDPRAARENPLSVTPGSREDNENATAYANRTEQEDTTSERPRRGGDGSPERGL
ncbi:MAG TPA: hypothetical protein VF615_30125 [Longimicrobiaceae bacterium]|jgi:hypothetical protein